MMILSVDPGTDRSGFVTFDGRRVHRAGVVFNDVMLAMVREPGIAGRAGWSSAAWGLPATGDAAAQNVGRQSGDFSRCLAGGCDG